MKSVIIILLGIWMLSPVTGVSAGATGPDHQALICEDLLVELSQPLPPPPAESAARDTGSLLEPLYSMETNKLMLLAIFGFSLVLMTRILFQMRVKARHRQISTHSCELHSHPSGRSHYNTAGKTKKNRSSGSSGGYSLNCTGMSIEQFHLNTMCERRPRYTRSYKRFAHSPSY